MGKNVQGCHIRIKCPVRLWIRTEIIIEVEHIDAGILERLVSEVVPGPVGSNISRGIDSAANLEQFTPTIFRGVQCAAERMICRKCERSCHAVDQCNIQVQQG